MARATLMELDCAVKRAGLLLKLKKRRQGRRRGQSDYVLVDPRSNNLVAGPYAEAEGVIQFCDLYSAHKERTA